MRVIEKLLKELWDVFALNYIEFWKITPHIVEHKIELDTIIPLVHQKKSNEPQLCCCGQIRLGKILDY